MVRIEFEGKCKGCKVADLRLENIVVGGEKLWAVVCEHEYACQCAWERAMSEASSINGAKYPGRGE